MDEEFAIGTTPSTVRYGTGYESSSDESEASRRPRTPPPPEHRLRDTETKILKTNRKLASVRALLRNHPGNKSSINEGNQLAENLVNLSARIRSWANWYGLGDVDPDVVAILENEQLLVRKPRKRTS